MILLLLYPTRVKTIIESCVNILFMSIFVNRNQLISFKISIMKEVKKILLSKLQNLEIPELVEEVMRKLESYDLAALRLGDMGDLLLRQCDIAKSLTVPYGKHRQTKKLARLHKKRLKYASLINMQVKSFENVDDEDIQDMAMIARRLTKKYLTYLGRMNRLFAGQQIDSFFTILRARESEVEGEAFQSLGLQPFLDELKKTNIEYRNLFNERKRDIKSRPRTGDPVIKRETLGILQMFFDKVNTNQRIYKDIDYEDLIHSLNSVLTPHSKNIKTRIATNKRRARKKAEAEKAAAANVAKPVSVKEMAPSVIVETKTTNGVAVVATTPGATTNEEQTKPQSTISHQGTKAKEIPVKDLMKVVKRKRK